MRRLPSPALLLACASLLAAPAARCAPSLRFVDDFSAYPARMALEDAWQVVGGQAEARAGGLMLSGAGDTTTIALGAPHLDRQTLEVSVEPGVRASRAGWSAAGLALYDGPGNIWRVGLVQGPDGDRYADLVEMRGGIWQAQGEGATRLERLRGLAERNGKWVAGRRYRLRLTLMPGSIVGEVLDPASGAVIWRQGYAIPPGPAAVRGGRVALSTLDMRARFDDVRVLGPAPPPPRRRVSLRVAVHAGPQAAAYARAVRRAGYGAVLLTSRQLADPRALDPSRVDVLVLPDGRGCPIAGRDNLLRFLRGGGDMVVVRGPLFERSAREAAREWRRTLARAVAAAPFPGLEEDPAGGWSRGSDSVTGQTHWRSERTGPPRAPEALRVDLANLANWDTLRRPVSHAFPPGSDLTALWAKGGPRTTGMLVEWQERDGSRWIATIPLTTRWTRHVLTPEDFVYWPDNPSKGRGGSDDRFHPANAAHLTIGLGKAHADVPNGRHTYWVAGIGPARLPAGAVRPDLTLPTLEILSPSYKVYRLPSAHPTAAELQRAAATGNQTGPIVVPIARPRGLGSGGTRVGRWVPLRWVRDAQGRPRGARESLWISLGVPYRGAVWAYVACADGPSGLPARAATMVKRIAGGVFLARAGAPRFSYFPGQRAPLSAVAVNLGSVPRRVSLRLRLYRQGFPAPVLERESRMRLEPGRTGRVRVDWLPGAARTGLHRVVAELRVGGRSVDRIEQSISVAPDPGGAARDFVRVRAGDFWEPRAGSERKWYPYGVNYWQTNVAGADTAEFWGHWLAPQHYDPQIVERDLATFQSLGFTSLSISLGTSECVAQVNDFVYRAARHGIRVNLFLPGAHPFQTDEPLFTSHIREGRFARNPNIWAFDIAWEHHLGPQADRARWDGDWQDWIVERYGSVAHAESAWGYPAPRDEAGRITNPPDAHLRGDGPWLKMVSAYERCADDVISRRYGHVIRAIRALAPHQLISARSATQPSWTSWFAYDMASTGMHFDFASPEGYGLVPEEAGFSTAYGRWAGNGKPVFWAELGMSIYPYDTTGTKAAEQRELYRGFARMLVDSGASGLAGWWSVGGYRVDERSDFGVLAPDGTPRESALALRAAARRVTSPRETPRPDVWITVDRDRHAAAYQAVYEEHKAEYVRALRSGRHAGVRTEGTGTSSATCPLVAVGNLPYDGFSPLKHLNSEIVSLQVRSGQGPWTAVERDGTVSVGTGEPVMARLRVANTGEASWLAAGGEGRVYVIGDDRPDADSSALSRLAFSTPIPRDVPRYGDLLVPEILVSPGLRADSAAVFTLEAAGRARFGARRRVTLRVRP
ncbi:MAG: hypothetical protein IT208_19655 [Chthonomonadales bacterium]|nr:hypothetical protein [Chthonomonadales bacterium]